MLLSGKLRVWPSGKDFSNHLCQIIIIVTTQTDIDGVLDDQYFVFNGYMSDKHISQFNVLMNGYWDNIKVIQMTAHDPRIEAKNEVTDWAKTNGIQVFTHPITYLTHLELNIPKHKDIQLKEEVDLDTEI